MKSKMFLVSACALFLVACAPDKSYNLIETKQVVATVEYKNPPKHFSVRFKTEDGQTLSYSSKHCNHHELYKVGEKVTINIGIYEVNHLKDGNRKENVTRLLNVC